MKKRKLPGHGRARKTRQIDTVLGVCWYSPQDWERVKSTATDPDLFENTFSEWETMADESFTLIRTAYPNVTKVNISADEFFAWGLVHGRVNDSDTRTEFVADKLRQSHVN